jgi:predicted transcriptional regulator
MTEDINTLRSTLGHTIDCQGLMGRIFGHKFEPVFDTESSFKGDMDFLKNLQYQPIGPYLTEALEQVAHMRDVKTKYVQHVCRRCGEIVNRA